MRTQAIKTFNGIVSPAGWDRDNQIKKVTLYTDDGEDILLEHKNGIEKLKQIHHLPLFLDPLL